MAESETLELSEQLLDRLARLEPARRALALAVDLALAGGNADISPELRALLRQLDAMGLRVEAID